MKFLKKIFMLLFYFVLSSVVFADFTTIELPSDFSISYKKDFSDKEIRNMYYDLKLNDKVDRRQRQMCIRDSALTMQSQV